MAGFMLHTFAEKLATRSGPDLSTAKQKRNQKSAQGRPPGHAEKSAVTASLWGVLRGVNRAALAWGKSPASSGRPESREVRERKLMLAARMNNARNMKEWEVAAKELDALEGNNEWKLDTAVGDYQPDIIESRLRELDEARIDCDIPSMLYLIRTALSRDLGGMGSVDLYRHSYVGTKKLIERYVQSAIDTIEALVERSSPAPPPGMGPRDLLSGVLYARQSFGRSALLLSGGATFGMAHIGVLKALLEVDLLPRILSGASAGSILCSIVCSRTDEEMPALMRSFPYGDLGVFEEGQGRAESLADHLRRLLTEGSWLDIKHLTKVMRSYLGDMTFQEAYNRTRRICNIPVSSPSLYELPRLLNYVTAPNVMIWSAVAASCSVPFVFSSSPLLVKDPETGEHVPWNPTSLLYIDGSVDNDLPMTRLAEMFNVNHFIVSQVNPHVVPFLDKDDHLSAAVSRLGRQQSQVSLDGPDWLRTLTGMARDEALHRLQFLTEVGIFPNLCSKLRSVLSQKYAGDITIIPEISPRDLSRILTNPTPDFMLRQCHVGEKATWPKLSRIRDRCAIELALDRAVHRLRARVVFSESQADLRRLATGHGGPGLPATPGPHHATLSQAIQHAAGLGEHDPEGPRGHRRRGSGGSIQLLVRRGCIQRDLQLTQSDEEADEGQAVELSQRRRGQQLHLGNRASPSQPRLKRAAKSHVHLAGQRQSAPRPASNDGKFAGIRSGAPNGALTAPHPRKRLSSYL